MPSTVIAEFDYDQPRRILSIRFRPSGRRYLYRGVPPEAADAFRHATARGRYFNRHIRNRYACEPVEADERT